MVHMDQSNCPGRETRLEEEAAVLVCMNVDSNMLVSSEVKAVRPPGRPVPTVPKLTWAD